MGKDFLWKVCLDIYRQAFKEAKPSADFDELRKTGEAKKERFFMKYYLPEEKLTKIIDKHCMKNKVKNLEKRDIEKTICLGCAPNGCFETWQKERSR